MSRLIIGHTTHDSVKIWARGSARWPFAFIDVLDSTGMAVGDTRRLALDEADFHTGVLTWPDLEADTPYQVKVAFGKSARTPPAERIRDAYTHGRFHTFPSAPRPFSFLLGSCNLHSLGIIEKPDTAWLSISRIAAATDARFMLHCGDQIYADIPFGTRPDLDHYRDKYLDAWEDCRPAQRVLTELPHYMILDDHEITNNFDHQKCEADGDMLLNVAMKVYWEFQHKHNPDTPPIRGQRRYYYDFACAGARFFVLDTRYSRDASRGRMLDPTQMTRLKAWLKRHRSELKFVVSSVPFVGQVLSPEGDKWCDPAFDAQRYEILNHALDNDINRIVFLTGDMHTSYHASMRVRRGARTLTLHELMSSPINQFTPDTALKRKYDPDYDATLGDIELHNTIDPASFYGDHSNIMAVTVDGDEVAYQIHRTSRNRPGPEGRFRP